MKFNIITLFPESFEALNHSIIKRAQEKKLIQLNLINLRDFGIGAHKQVDDTPYGGGPGMVLKVDVIDRALRSLKLKSQNSNLKNVILSDRRLRSNISRISSGANRRSEAKTRTILLTPQGKRYTQADAKRLSKYDNLTLICGHYEGFDERIRELCDEQISIGDYVLTGGELPAMILVDSITRLLPGVLGKDESSKDESFSSLTNNHLAISDKPLLEYPQYTRPLIYKNKKVPKILLSGNHAEIAKWREQQSIKRSKLFK